jgi:modulator of FtsH protease HflK
MYIEAIEDIMSKSKKVILDSKGGAGGNMIYLPLDKLLERSTPPRGVAPAPTTAPQQVEELQGVTIEGRNRGVR